MGNEHSSSNTKPIQNITKRLIASRRKHVSPCDETQPAKLMADIAKTSREHTAPRTHMNQSTAFQLRKNYVIPHPYLNILLANSLEL